MSRRQVTPYTATFARLQPRHDPQQIEAFVRLEYSTLDHLNFGALRREAAIAADCIDAIGVEAAEETARSIGLVTP